MMNKKLHMKNIEKITEALKTCFGEELEAAILYGSVMNEDCCKDSDYDVLLVFSADSFSTYTKLRNLKAALEADDIKIDFNVQLKSELPANRGTMFWHNNRCYYVQMEMEICGIAIIGKNPFEDSQIDSLEMKKEAVRMINSFNYQTRKFLINKELSNDNKRSIIKWCLYGALFVLAANGIFVENRAYGMTLFDERYQLELKAQDFLEIKVSRSREISEQDLENAYVFLQQLDQIAYRELQIANTKIA